MKKLVYLLLLISSGAFAQVKISQLPSANALTGAELIPVVQSNVTKKTTVDSVKSFLNITPGWSLTGNSGTNPATDFIGTVDSVGLSIGTAGTEAIHVDSLGRTYIGKDNCNYNLNVVGGIFQSADTCSDVKFNFNYGNINSQTVTSINEFSYQYNNYDANIFQALSINGGGIAINSTNNITLNSSGQSNVGIGTTTPDSTLTVTGSGHITGDLLVDGKITATGGVDPPYVSFKMQTHDQIRERSKSVTDDVMQFYCETEKRMELYIIKDNVFTPLR